MHDTLPYRLALKGLYDGYGLGQPRLAGVHAFDGAQQFDLLNLHLYVPRCHSHNTQQFA
jgi:hypothetical protein